MEKLIYNILSVEFTLSAVDSPLFQLLILYLKLNSKSELLKFLFSLVTGLMLQLPKSSVFHERATDHTAAKNIVLLQQDLGSSVTPATSSYL